MKFLYVLLVLVPLMLISSAAAMTDGERAKGLTGDKVPKFS